MGPRFNGQIRLGVKANTEDHDGEETSDVAREFPIFPFARLTWSKRCSVEEVALGSFFVAGAFPSACTGAGATADSERGEETLTQHGGGDWNVCWIPLCVRGRE